MFIEETEQEVQPHLAALQQQIEALQRENQQLRRQIQKLQARESSARVGQAQEQLIPPVTRRSSRRRVRPSS